MHESPLAALHLCIISLHVLIKLRHSYFDRSMIVLQCASPLGRLDTLLCALWRNYLLEITWFICKNDKIWSCSARRVCVSVETLVLSRQVSTGWLFPDADEEMWPPHSRFTENEETLLHKVTANFPPSSPPPLASSRPHRQWWIISRDCAMPRCHWRVPCITEPPVE